MKAFNKEMMKHYRQTKIEHIKDLMERTEKSLKFAVAGLGYMPAFPRKYTKQEWEQANQRSVEQAVLLFLNELNEIIYNEHNELDQLTDFARMVYWYLKKDMDNTDYSEL